LILVSTHKLEREGLMTTKNEDAIRPYLWVAPSTYIGNGLKFWSRGEGGIKEEEIVGS
jgi:hypothetical protein